MPLKFKTLHTCFILFFIGVCGIQAQVSLNKDSAYKILRSNLGVGGTSKQVSIGNKKYIFSQSIGQSSVIGTSNKNGYYLRQGYQQPLTGYNIKSSSNNTIRATVYPNPFNQSVSVSFSEKTNHDIYVSIYDIVGKLVYIENFAPSKLIQINLKNYSTGSYVLKAVSNGKLFNAKIIKI